MLKTLAFIVIVFFVTLWSTGNDLASLKQGLTHWADGNAAQTSGDRSNDWGV